jgi:hypothetical protein
MFKKLKPLYSLNWKGKNSNNVFGYIYGWQKGIDILSFEEYILGVWSFWKHLFINLYCEQYKFFNI